MTGQSSAPVSPHRRTGLFLLGVLAMFVFVGIASNAEQFSTSSRGPDPNRVIVPNTGGVREFIEESESTPQEPVEFPENLAIGLAIAVGLGLLYLLSRQRFRMRLRRPSISIATGDDVEVTEEEQAETIAEFARDLIDELREGDSPRLAIQRAYAAVETGFGAKELARKQAETPLRYLSRIFGRHSNLKEPLESLTGLFQLARFSDEPVDETMRNEAIDSLATIRDHYTAHAWQRIEAKERRARERSRA